MSERPILLVVEDEPAVLRVLVRLLGRLGEVLTASDAAQAIQALEAGPVDLVLSDQTMPGMSGDLLLAEVARRWPATERVLMSGYADTGRVQQGLSNGDIGCLLSKPLDSQALLRELGARAQRAWELRHR